MSKVYYLDLEVSDKNDEKDLISEVNDLLGY